ncbi:hypothetical protein Nepgr_005293 [Nepenthes gracilis]|uniref:Uncharacterized protein n=1 Tax=Nepenthes gracilis TaxID=150966 RepID=A0AAD3S2X4_NEPGR|nr:hypothetical protein Nepgr_005293 [Nepenthes gracilis]
MALGLGSQDVDGPILLVCLCGFSFSMVSADAEDCCWGRSLNFGWLKVADAEGCWFGVLFLYVVAKVTFAVGTIWWKSFVNAANGVGLLKPWSQIFFCAVAAIQQPKMVPMVSELVHYAMCIAVPIEEIPGTVSLNGLAAQSMLAVLQLRGGWVDFFCSADAWLGMIQLQKAAGLECCYCKMWLMPLLMWDPFAAFVVWIWLQFWTGNCLPCPWISPKFNSAAELLPSGKSIVTMMQFALVFGVLESRTAGRRPPLDFSRSHPHHSRQVTPSEANANQPDASHCRSKATGPISLVKQSKSADWPAKLAQPPYRHNLPSFTLASSAEKCLQLHLQRSQSLPSWTNL